MSISFEQAHLHIVISLIYGLGAVGLSLVIRYLKFIDLTTYVSIVVGSIAVISITNNLSSFGRYTFVFSIIFASLLGGVLGLLTYVQIRYLRVPPILAGILTNVAGVSLEFYLSDGLASVDFSTDQDNALIQTLNSFISNTFSLGSIAYTLIICVIVCFLFAFVLFKSNLGIYILALLGSENYLEYRHRKKNQAMFMVLVIGNTTVAFAGALAAIQNRSASTSINHPDFLVIALGGISLGGFILQVLSNNNISKHLIKENKPSSWKLLPIIAIIHQLQRNEEDSVKIFITLLTYLASAGLINIVFKVIETSLSDDRLHFNFAIKAFIILVILLVIHIWEYISKKN
jgi:putative tryptophan/tyrosine transport system permease protein